MKPKTWLTRTAGQPWFEAPDVIARSNLKREGRPAGVPRLSMGYCIEIWPAYEEFLHVILFGLLSPAIDPNKPIQPARPEALFSGQPS